MPVTPADRGGQAPEGSRYPSQVLGENVARIRQRRKWNQSELAARMATLGHGWRQSTVSDVEKAVRNTTVEELIGLCLALGTTLAELLDPGEAGLYVGDVEFEGSRQLPPPLAKRVSRSQVAVQMDEGSLSFSYPGPDREATQAAIDELREHVRQKNLEGQEGSRSGHPGTRALTEAQEREETGA